ncbi:DMSO reductase subunit C [Cellulomonas hominis]|uniref:Anaerobic dimethyl sulfoxide reductase subunit C (Anchor subunit) n=1 Tax=Cellulomonas hominis TaxID=156981 RepID=A0A511F9J9_9CELL|nr:DmsC/YnfH family molybdoenzyme membrane anchor subunit [Cellulomonas hominis]MBB5472948.1 anaerobic dimethyl sulfoxide reductase subunit C (anchor subunit) [Cellulomonas hominis]NKY06627.1 dimethyl sulfoxide reductase anchor subunit [Cellulomonas hominis]GEL45915.1 DMSO reductase subunit C [Cellulomonas hominis]
MHVSELPLVTFTILAQLAVGSFVVLGVVQLVARRRGGAAVVDRLSDPALYAIGPVMVLGLLASILHLGNPINMLHTIRHWDSSWLSREILFGCTFAALGAAFAVCQWRHWFTPVLRQVLAGVTAVVGLGLVYVMSMVYMLPTVPAWNTWATPVSFFTTTLLLGTLNIGAAFVGVTAYRRRRGLATDPEVDALLQRTLRGVAVAAIVLVGVEFVVAPTYALTLATAGDGASAVSADALMIGSGAALVVRLVLVFLGAALLGVLLYKAASSGRQRMMFAVATGAFVLVLASEGLGRVLFYESMTRIGM